VAPPASGSGEEMESAPVIKLRPRTAPAAAPAPPAPPLSDPIPKPTPAGVDSLPAPPPAAVFSGAGGDGEPQKFKFKPKGLDNAPTPSFPPSATEPPAPPPPDAETTPMAPPPFPVLASATESGTRAPIPIHIRAPKNLREEELPQPTEIVINRPPKRKKPEIRAVLAGVVFLLLAGGGGYFTFQHFYQVPPTPTPAPTPKTKANVGPKPAATPSDTLNALAAAPGKLLDSAQDAVAARRSGEQSRVDAMLTGEDPTGQRALRTPLPGELGGRPAPAKTPPLAKVSATAALAPGVSVTTEINASREASPAFRSFVAEAKVTGVFQGSPARAFINGRLCRAGTLVEEGLGITFVDVDAENRLLIFKDRFGAQVTKGY